MARMIALLSLAAALSATGCGTVAKTAAPTFATPAEVMVTSTGEAPPAIATIRGRIQN